MILAMAAAVASLLAIGVMPAAATPSASGVQQQPPAAVGAALTGAEQAPPALDGGLRAAFLRASDGGNDDRFGRSVSISGDTAVIGAAFDSTDAGLLAGSAYVLLRSGDTWTEQARLTASDAAAFESFGLQVAISGNIAVVSSDNGKVYVFARSGTSWTEQARLTGFAGPTTVTISGTTLLVGDDRSSAGGPPPTGRSVGAAYVFVRSGTSWHLRAKLTASDGTTDDYFGSSVDLSGDTAVIGASGVGGTQHLSTGAAYIFLRSGTNWTEQAKLTGSDAAADARFGDAASVSADTVVIGAYGQDGRTGAAYVYVRSGTTWTEQAKLTAPDVVDFGFAVDVSGATVLVGAPGDVGSAPEAPGSAYVFVRSGTAWSQVARLQPASTLARDNYGAAVALDIRSAALVGASEDDTSAGRDAGSAWAYSFSA